MNETINEELPLVLTTKDVAGVLGVSMTTVYHIIASGELKSVRVRHQIRVSRDALLSFLNGVEQEQYNSGGLPFGSPPLICVRCQCRFNILFLFRKYREIEK